MLTQFTKYNQLIALIIFVVASITDHFDGHIARKYNMITTFGKFMDPIADKLLVSSALICLTALGSIPAWAVIVIILREFAVSGLRLVAAENGGVIAAAGWGKAKTAAQMTAIIMLLIPIPQLYPISMIVFYISVVLTVVSLVDFMLKNKAMLITDK
jgi:CDP-diacylglycerol--glycerol-3-phosphate 3-phosphatidyltransferase